MSPWENDEKIIRAVARKATLLSPEQRVRELTPLVEHLNAAIEADRRWVRGLLPIMLLVSASKLEGENWVPVQENVTTSLLDPYAAASRRSPVSSEWTPQRDQKGKIAAGFDVIANRHEMEAKTRWSARLSMLDREIERRSYVVAVDGHDNSSVQRLRVDEAKRRLAAATASGVPLTIGRAQVAYNAAADIAAFGESAYIERVKWLHVLGQAARAPKPVPTFQIAVRLSEQR